MKCRGPAQLAFLRFCGLKHAYARFSEPSGVMIRGSRLFLATSGSRHRPLTTMENEHG